MVDQFPRQAMDSCHGSDAITADSAGGEASMRFGVPSFKVDYVS